MKYFLLCLFTSACFGIKAQNMNWKQHEKMAGELMAKGQYAQAADNYELAWEEKPAKKELLANAANAYRLLRDYRKAASSYKPLIDNSDFPLARLHYGRCLKQDGQYQEARRSLQTFIDNYKGADKATLIPLVQIDLQGCGLAQEWSRESSNSQNTVQYLSGINTGRHEFAPLPFSDDILYFSSTKKDRAGIYRSQRKQGRFSNAVVPDLPRTPGGHFCHGSFTPDNERFYFTVCQGDEAWKGMQSKCELYVTMREQNSWSVPQKMRDYVKLDGTTVSQPFVIHEGDTETLYFSSDRSGGKGGLDIWYMTRQIAGKDIDFTYPVNAGAAINTAGDEVSPFYNQRAGQLYFSSNGHSNIGGFDIFQVEGNPSNWSSAKNMGQPYNSSADDYYFIQTPSGEGAFFASNRPFGAEKVGSIDDDLFFIGESTAAIASGVVSGTVYDQSGGTAMTNVEVAIYEKVDTGLKRLLKAQVFPNGQYSFPILPEREFLIEVNKDGYAEATFEFNTYQYSGNDPGRPVYLEKKTVAVSSVPKTVSPPPVVSSTPSVSSISSPSTSPVNTPPQESMASKGTTSRATTLPSNPPIITSSNSPTYTNSRFNKDGVTTNAPKHSGVYYKVQLSVVIDYDLEAATFAKMQDMGRLDTEYIIEKGWTRVLLADFFNLEEARQMMVKSQLIGFPEAFIVKYENGYRKN